MSEEKTPEKVRAEEVEAFGEMAVDIADALEALIPTALVREYRSDVLRTVSMQVDPERWEPPEEIGGSEGKGEKEE